jgi:hypothetical protein
LSPASPPTHLKRARADRSHFDLVPAQNWPVLKKYGLTSPSPTVKSMRPAIDECAAGGCPNMITVSGSRLSMSDAGGADNSGRDGVQILNHAIEIMEV